MLTLMNIGVFILSALSAAVASDGIGYPGESSGEAVVVLSEDRITLENKALSASWDIANNRLQFLSFADKSSAAENTAGKGEAFIIHLGNGHSLKASEFTLAAAPESKSVAANTNAYRLVERYAGCQVSATLLSPDVTLAG